MVLARLCVESSGLLPALGTDLLTVSAHKLGGPKSSALRPLRPPALSRLGRWIVLFE